jgi:bifunctional non-homologous end joining protein LigD
MRNRITTNKTGGKKLHFVVQRHKASHLHYDLRLEISGKLKSWALKKGPSMNSKDRRLAVLTKDHPLVYRFYRGIVPGPIWKGGKMNKLGWRIVEIWDRGYYAPYETTRGKTPDEYMEQGLNKGSLKIIFHGKKLKGLFVLVKMPSDNKAAYNTNRSWLLIKQEDKYAVHTVYNSERLTPRFSLINRALKASKK